MNEKCGHSMGIIFLLRKTGRRKSCFKDASVKVITYNAYEKYKLDLYYFDEKGQYSEISCRMR